MKNKEIVKNMEIYILPLLALLTLLLYNVLPYHSSFVERWYSRGIFAFYRVMWDSTIARLPFAIIYLVVIGTLVYLIWPLRDKIGFRSKSLTFFSRMIKLVSLGIIIFYWLWAFNYKRQSFRSATSMEVQEPAPSFVYKEYCRVTDSLVAIRSLIREDLLSTMDIDEHQLRNDLTNIYDLLDLPYSGRVRAVKIRPKGTLLHISTAGVYLPFSGEGHIDAGLHLITHPFTMMHEMSHGYGWTGEDVCNFLALLGTVNSEHIGIRYSGYFGYWRYLRAQLYRLDAEHFNQFYREIPEVILKDYLEIMDYADRYTDIMPILRDFFYDQYLKSHGISSGLVSYSEMIKLSYDWHHKYGDLLVRSK